MSVTGYLSLYTTLIGWQQYQQLWNLMVGTGLVFIPFIGIVLKAIIEPFESQEPKNAAVIALRRLLIQVVGALLIIEFCCVPTVSLNPKVLHYQPLCVANATVATPGHSGTHYDNQFTVPTGVKVPILWYLVMAISNGFTVAASDGLPCAPIDYQALQDQLNVSHLDDPTLKKSTVNFYNDCYVPVYSRYISGDLTDSQKASIQLVQLQNGKDDVGWLGSQVFLTVPGFYDSLFARQPITGFPYNPQRDQFEGQVSNHSQWGEPSCSDWWTDKQYGLHQQLKTALPPSFLQSLLHLSNPNMATDMGIRRLIQHSFDTGMNSSEIGRGYESLNDDNTLGFGSALLSNIGVMTHQLNYYPTLYLLINALPIIQSLLLLVFYALLALFIPFASYRLHFIVIGSLMIFTVTFWSYLWHLVAYLDNVLIAALYPTDNNAIIPSWHTILQGGGGLEMTFVHFVIGTLYIILPLIFFAMMGWAGFQISNMMTSVMNTMEEPIKQSGQAGMNFSKQLILDAAQAISKKR